MGDDDTGLVTRPCANVRTVPLHRRALARHPTVRRRAPCAICGARAGFPYAHPNPLRTRVVLDRCKNHRGPRFAQEDPKAAPGGGRYR